MKANYHTHTWRCNHAAGHEEQYAENAVLAGLEVLGFSDHSPYIFPRGHISTFRMEIEMLDGYVRKILSLREQFRGQLEIPLGLEIEYYPKLLPQLMPILLDQPMDYLILGQHFVGNEYDAPYNGLGTEDENLLRQYVSQTCDAMHKGFASYFAHPDLIHFRGSDSIYRKHMRHICREAKQCGVPLEYNLLGLAGGRNYPDRRFWEMAAEEGCDVILGRDAHNPEALLDEKTEERALENLSRLGLKPLERVKLRGQNCWK